MIFLLSLLILCTSQFTLSMDSPEHDQTIRRLLIDSVQREYPQGTVLEPIEIRKQGDNIQATAHVDLSNVLVQQIYPVAIHAKIIDGSLKIQGLEYSNNVGSFQPWITTRVTTLVALGCLAGYLIGSLNKK